MNVPNMLTMLRFALIPVYVVVFASDVTNHMRWALLIIVLAGLTDILDGYWARKYGQVTTVGSMLDPLADKSMMIAVILSLLVTGHIPWMAGAAIFVRDAGMIVGSAYFHFRGKKTVPANWMGKLTTILYYLGICFIFFEAAWARSYLWGVIAFSFVTSFIYIGQFMALNRESKRAKIQGVPVDGSPEENQAREA